MADSVRREYCDWECVEYPQFRFGVKTECGHFQNWPLEYVENFKYCPYCGKEKTVNANQWEMPKELAHLARW